MNTKRNVLPVGASIQELGSVLAPVYDGDIFLPQMQGFRIAPGNRCRIGYPETGIPEVHLSSNQKNESVRTVPLSLNSRT